MQKPTDELVTVGRITTVYGVKGWVKVHSFTEPQEALASYQPWQLLLGKEQKVVEVDACKHHGIGLIAHIKGCDDRDKAILYRGASIRVPRSALPAPGEGEYYWHQLEGLQVVTESGVKLGRVDHLLETGANDVLVVLGDEESIDQRERLIPYLPDRVVKKVDLDAAVMTVDWDPEF